MLIYCTLQMHVQQATYANELHVNVQHSTVFGVVDDTTTTKFVNRACAVHSISLPVVVDKVVVVVLKFPIVLRNFLHSDRDTKGILTFGK